MQKVQAILFDFDGVIMDTDNSYRALVSELLSNEFNYPITLEECIKRWKGKNATQIAQELFFEGMDFTDEFVTKIHRLSEDYKVDESIIVNNAKDLLKSVDLPKGICSNGRSVRVKQNLDDVNLLEYFEFVLGRDDLKAMKPDPQVYLKGADKFGIDIKNCLVVEDSLTGLQAGIEAGAITIGFIGTGGNEAGMKELKPNYIIENISEIIDIIKKENLND